jgi:hypothetical protein
MFPDALSWPSVSAAREMAMPEMTNKARSVIKRAAKPLSLILAFEHFNILTIV